MGARSGSAGPRGAAGDRLQLAVKTGSAWSATGAHLVGDLQIED